VTGDRCASIRIGAGPIVRILDASVRLEAASTHALPRTQYGHFIEHLGRCINGGIWSPGEASISNRTPWLTLMHHSNPAEYNTCENPQAVGLETAATRLQMARRERPSAKFVLVLKPHSVPCAELPLRRLR